MVELNRAQLACLLAALHVSEETELLARMDHETAQIASDWGRCTPLTEAQREELAILLMRAQNPHGGAR